MSDSKENNMSIPKFSLIFLAILFIVIIRLVTSCSNSTTTNSEAEPSTASSTISAATPSTTATPSTAVATPSKVAEPSETKQVPKIDFSTAAVTEENIKTAIIDMVDAEKLKSVELSTADNKTIIDIFYDPGMVWDEQDLVDQTARTATATMEVLFKNPKIDKIWFWTTTKMTDAKGNEADENVVNVCLTKENAKDINWPKFKEMVYSDYHKLFDIADGSFIYPGIKAKLEK